MAYVFDKEESVAAGARRIVTEELDTALALLSPETGSPDPKAVHDARKGFKRLRSLLRLVKPVLPPDLYAREWTRLRDCGLGLAAMRDAHVMWMTYRELVRQSGRKVGRAKRGGNEAVDVLRRDSAAHGRREEGWRAVATSVREARESLNGWPLECLEWSMIREGLRKTYRRGARWMRDLNADGPPEDFHEWRKAAKHFYHQMLLVEPMNPDRLRGIIGSVDNLAEELGREHDMAVLQSRLGTLRRQGHPVDATVSRLLGRRRRASQKAALSLGGHVYRDKPRAFAARLDRHWTKWHEDTL